jgi:SprT protein
MLTTNQKQQVATRTQECLELFARKTNKEVFPMPEILYDVCGTTGGYVLKGRVHYNERLAAENFQDYLDNTIPHETAHYIQRKLYPFSKAHGAEWKYVMRILGVPATRCHEYNTENVKVRHVQKFEVTCNCMTHEVTKKVFDTLHVRRCGRCKSRLTPKVKISFDFASIPSPGANWSDED